MIGREILVVGSHLISHGLPAWQSVIETACTSFESVTSVNSHLSCAFLSSNRCLFSTLGLDILKRSTNEMRLVMVNGGDVSDLDLEEDAIVVAVIGTPLVSPFIDSDEELDDREVLIELNKYGNAGNFYHDRIIFSIERDDLTFPCMIGFRKTRSTGRNLVAIVRDVYVFVESFTYVTDFVVLEDIGEFIISDMSEVVMGRPFRSVTQLEYDCLKSLISFTRIFDTYIFRMPRTIPRRKDFSWSKVPPILVLSHRDLMSRLRYPYEKNK
ncbi:hypothetical protein Tco_0796069 [Tanacetum coccineum]